MKSNEKSQAFQSAHGNPKFEQTKIECATALFNETGGGKPTEKNRFVKNRILRLMKAWGSHRLEALSAIHGE